MSVQQLSLLAVAVVAVAAVSAAPHGSIPQYYSGADDASAYNWGYDFPGRSHFESKDHQGIVRGTYTFVDANNALQQTSYSAHPVTGYTQEAVAPTAGDVIEKAAAPVQYSAPVQAGFEGWLPAVEDWLSPTLLERAAPELRAALDSGALVPVPALRGPAAPERVFRVADHVLEQAAGSVSRLATLVGADLPAAQHDQQTPLSPAGPTPYAADEGVIRGVLEPQYRAEGDVYFVRVPVA